MIFKKLEDQTRAEGINRFCVRGLIVDHNKILLLQRAFHDSLPGIYELPGGAVEPNETLDNALIREIKEETGLLVREIGAYLGFFDYKSKKSNTLTRQFSFVLKIDDISRIIISSDHDNYQWVELDLIKYVKFQVNETIFSLIDEYRRLI